MEPHASSYQVLPQVTGVVGIASALKFLRNGAVGFIVWLRGVAFTSWLAAPSRRVSPQFETRTKRQTTVW